MVEKETTVTRPDPDVDRSSLVGRVALVVVAGAGPDGLGAALEVFDALPRLSCPTVFSLRDVDPSPLHARIDDLDVQLARDGARLVESRVWIAPADRNTMVRRGAFELGAPGERSVGDLPSLGKLYHSAHVEFGSRVFAVIADALRADGPMLRRLAQRGADVVSPLDAAADVPAYRTIDQIAENLIQRAGVDRPEQQAVVA